MERVVVAGINILNASFVIMLLVFNVKVHNIFFKMELAQFAQADLLTA